MIPRHAEKSLLRLAKGFYVVVVTGPRQSGKTTLVRNTFAAKQYASLEDPDLRQFALEDPRRFLDQYHEGAILDEVQRCPELFSYLQSRIDQDQTPGHFILTGSHSFDLLAGVTQSLAGRAGLLRLLPFSLAEIDRVELCPESLEELLLKGLYPPLYDREVLPQDWYGSYVRTYVERDLRQLIQVRNLSTFQRFLRMCAARAGQLLNLSNLAADCGISHNTASSWISILEASSILYLLRPHHQNFNKRLVKTPKLYFYDSGLAAWLLGIHSTEHLAIHSSRGALFENWVLTELLKGRYNRGLESNLTFWRDHTGNEVDCIIDRQPAHDGGRNLFPVEMKSGQTITGDMLASLQKWLGLAAGQAGQATLCYGGDQAYERSGITVLPWRDVASWAETG